MQNSDFELKVRSLPQKTSPLTIARSITTDKSHVSWITSVHRIVNQSISLGEIFRFDSMRMYIFTLYLLYINTYICIQLFAIYFYMCTVYCTHTCRCFIIFHFMFHSLTSHGQCWLLCSQEAAVKSELGRLLVWSGKRPFRSGGTWGSYKKDSPFVHWFSAIYVGAPSPSICKDSVRGPPSNQTCVIPS